MMSGSGPSSFLFITSNHPILKSLVRLVNYINNHVIEGKLNNDKSNKMNFKFSFNYEKSSERKTKDH